MKRYQPDTNCYQILGLFCCKAFGRCGLQLTATPEIRYHYTAASWHFDPGDHGGDNLESSPMLP